MTCCALLSSLKVNSCCVAHTFIRFTPSFGMPSVITAVSSFINFNSFQLISVLHHSVALVFAGTSSFHSLFSHSGTPLIIRAFISVVFAHGFSPVARSRYELDCLLKFHFIHFRQSGHIVVPSRFTRGALVLVPSSIH